MSAKSKRIVRRTLYRNGIVAVEECFSGQKLHGRRRTRYRNGQLATEEFYHDGLLHGICRQWNENGRLLGSFRMEHGTGTQKSWHDNGRLSQEFTTIEGKFCGRSRMWLRDGTLITDEVLLFGRPVTPNQYRKAAAKDQRFPKLRGRIGKPPLNHRAMKRHAYEVFISRLMSKRNRCEARAWLNAGNKTSRSLGNFKRATDALKFIEELYQACAVQVIAPDIYRNQRGDQFADGLIVELPKNAAKRKAIRKVCQPLRKGERGASVQPDKDTGEDHLYLLLA